MTPADIVTEARSWIDVPYQHQGRTRNGIDCLGLLVMIARRFDVTDYDELTYSRNPSGARMRRLLSLHLQPISIAEAGVGDVLHLAAGNEPQHVAIISRVDPLYFIHATSEFGRVVEQRIDDAGVRAVRGVYRVPEVH